MVGRPERRLAPADGPVARFALDLRKLREAAGQPSYRRMAARAHYSPTALSDAAGGERLPSLAVTLAYVEVCGGDGQEWELRWRATSTELAEPADDARAREPYVGLLPFQPRDADRFFGREQLVRELVDRVERTPVVAVIGPSGSGKSSLLGAGLVAAAERGDMPGDHRWQPILVVPGAAPLRALAQAVTTAFGGDADGLHDELTGGGPDALDIAVRQGLTTGPNTHALLVVDQFEELFTLCRDRAERDRFVDGLLDAALGQDRRTHVVIGVRADFYERCLEHAGLVGALRDHAQLPVGTMSEPELRRAIAQPAIQAGLSVQPELIATVVAEVAGKPGALPLLSHTLRETWRHAPGHALTLADYQAVGGVHGALAQTAERVYHDLAAAQRAVARRILLRLTALGEGTQDTRRRAARGEIDALGTTSETAGVLERLAEARLVVLDDDGVQLAHEALIKAWPRLHRWLTDDRDGLRVHRELTVAAQAWQALDRDPGSLYRGLRLAVASEWAEAHPDDLTALERAFLSTATANLHAERKAGRCRQHEMLALVTALSVLLVASVSMGVFAWRQRQSAVAQQQAAQSRQLAAEAMAAAPTRVGDAARLADRAYHTSPTAEARSSLLSLAGQQPYRMRLSGHAGAVGSVAYSPDGTLLVTGGWDRTVRFWDADTGAALATLNGHAKPVQAVTVSPDGKLVASGGGDGTVIVWDIAGRRKLRSLTGRRAPVTGLGFSRDGRRLWSVSSDETSTVWDPHSGAVVSRPRFGFPSPAAPTDDDNPLASLSGYRDVRARAIPVAEQVLAGLAFTQDGKTGHIGPDPRSNAQQTGSVFAVSGDGRRFASSLGDSGITVDGTARDPAQLFLVGHSGPVRTMAFAPDRRTLVSADSAGVTYLWDLGRQARLVTLAGHLGPVNDVTYSPDGRRIAAAGDDGTVVVWDRTWLPLVSHTAPVTDVAFSPDGRQLASSGADSTAVLWDVQTRGVRAVLSARQLVSAPMTSVAFDRDGWLLAAGGGHQIQLWDATNHRHVGALTGHAGVVSCLAFSPDGRVLAGGDSDGTVALWDPARRQRVASFRPGGAVHTVAFAADGRTLATAGDNRTVTLYDVAARTTATLPEQDHDINRLAFTPDGHLLATAGGDGSVELWDVSHRSLVATLKGHAAGVRAVAFSPDGTLLASAGLDRTIVLWDVPRRAPWATLSGHTEGVTGVAFSPDGAVLASASEDHTIITWPIRLDTAAARTQALAG